MSDSLSEAAHVEQLGTIVAHLKAFAQTFNAGDEVDEESGLTADDLFGAVELLEALHGMALVAPPAPPAAE